MRNEKEKEKQNRTEWSGKLQKKNIKKETKEKWTNEKNSKGKKIKEMNRKGKERGNGEKRKEKIR